MKECIGQNRRTTHTFKGKPTVEIWGEFFFILSEESKARAMMWTVKINISR